VRTTEVASELVANVLQVLVAVGQPVVEGDELVMLESM
jgi:biotin carboxyl carrier protein